MKHQTRLEISMGLKYLFSTFISSYMHTETLLRVKYNCPRRDLKYCLVLCTKRDLNSRLDTDLTFCCSTQGDHLWVFFTSLFNSTWCNLNGPPRPNRWALISTLHCICSNKGSKSLHQICGGGDVVVG